MSIERSFGEIVFTCDECESEQFETGTDDFNEALTKLKSEGWLVVKYNEDFVHVCPDCGGDEIDD